MRPAKKVSRPPEGDDVIRLLRLDKHAHLFAGPAAHAAFRRVMAAAARAGAVVADGSDVLGVLVPARAMDEELKDVPAVRIHDPEDHVET